MMNDCIQALPSLSDPALAVPTSPVDAEIERLRAALDGDGRAFAALVSPHLPMLYRVAAREARNEALAEDAVQEALVIVHDRLDRYQPGTSLKAWLAAIVVNRARTLARGERRRVAREEVAQAPQPLPSPTAQVDASDLADRVRAALDTLPPKRRQAAILRLDGGMSHGEIADAMGSTEGSVRVLVHLAMKTLRQVLGQTSHEGG
jgi:RNA polymerase sigma-70 factor (ECF subfamily)